MGERKIKGNLVWRFLERVLAQLVTFVVSLVLARLLSPDEYGQIEIITIIIVILNVFIDSGFGNALIQKKDSDDLDFSTVFFFNIVFCIIIYTVLFFGADFLGIVYDDQALVPLTRVLGLTIIVSALKNVQQAYVSKNLLFKKFFFSTLAGTIISAILGILFALKGYGAWALVIQHLSNVLIDTIVLWVIVDWKPKLFFSFERLKKLFSFGNKLLVSSLIYTLYNNIRQLIIGKKYSKSDLAFYNRGQKFPSLIISNVNTSIDSVLFPSMSKIQDEKERLVNLIKKSVTTSTYVIWPCLFGMAAVSTQLVQLLLGNSWNGVAPFLCVFCVIYSTTPIQTANLNAIKAIGRSDIYLKLEIIETIYAAFFLLLTVNIGSIWIAIAYAVSELLNVIVIMFVCNKIFGFGPLKQCRCMIKNFLSSLIMFAVVFAFGQFFSGWWIIFVQILLGVSVYLFLSVLSKNENYYYFKSITRNLIGRKKRTTNE